MNPSSDNLDKFRLEYYSIAMMFLSSFDCSIKTEIQKEISKIQISIADLEAKINSINSNIKTSTGFEQERLNQEITNLRADLAGLNARLENSDKRLNEALKQKEALNKNLLDLTSEIEKLKK